MVFDNIETIVVPRTKERRLICNRLALVITFSLEENYIFFNFGLDVDPSFAFNLQT